MADTMISFASQPGNKKYNFTVDEVGVNEYGGQNSVHSEYVLGLLNHKIIVVCQRYQYQGHYRLMEALAGGALVLADPMYPLPKGLEHKQSLIIYESLEDLSHYLKYYLENEKERLKIAKSGYDVAMEYHQSHNRIEYFVFGDWDEPFIEWGLLPATKKEETKTSFGDYRGGCTSLLSTFPNSGTGWTQAIFSSATGLLSEAIYAEGPKSKYSNTFIHGNDNRFQLPSITTGDCRLVKSHKRVSYKVMPRDYQRAVVLYRDPNDNMEANLRYLHKESLKKSLNNRLIEYCPGVDFLRWEKDDPKSYMTFSKMHTISHTRFYCHAQKYPVPSIFVTYAHLLNNPMVAFQNILMFVGYPNANVTKALMENPMKNNSIVGSLAYTTFDDETCEDLDKKFKLVNLNISECIRKTTQMLQF